MRDAATGRELRVGYVQEGVIRTVQASHVILACWNSVIPYLCPELPEAQRQALAYAVDHVPMPPEFMAAEIDRYIVMPGQALAYLTGKLEIDRLRDEARRRLGPAFSLPDFHAAVLDHGSLPMPTLARSIATWLDGLEGAAD